MNIGIRGFFYLCNKKNQNKKHEYEIELDKINKVDEDLHEII